MSGSTSKPSTSADAVAVAVRLTARANDELRDVLNHRDPPGGEVGALVEVAYLRLNKAVGVLRGDDRPQRQLRETVVPWLLIGVFLGPSLLWGWPWWANVALMFTALEAHSIWRTVARRRHDKRIQQAMPPPAEPDPADKVGVLGVVCQRLDIVRADLAAAAARVTDVRDEVEARAFPLEPPAQNETPPDEPRQPDNPQGHLQPDQAVTDGTSHGASRTRDADQPAADLPGAISGQDSRYVRVYWLLVDALALLASASTSIENYMTDSLRCPPREPHTARRLAAVLDTAAAGAMAPKDRTSQQPGAIGLDVSSTDAGDRDG